MLVILELPPRARRIPITPWRRIRSLGTTSACAENTINIGGLVDHGRNYLRVRGEYERWIMAISFAMELPPRARRIHSSLVVCVRIAELPPRARRILNLLIRHLDGEGTTSACAENTDFGGASDGLLRNYLRVRGEYTYQVLEDHAPPELPPRARRIQCSLRS